MADKTDTEKLREKAERIRAELAILKRKTEILDAKPVRKQTSKKPKPAPKKTTIQKKPKESEPKAKEQKKPDTKAKKPKEADSTKKPKDADPKAKEQKKPDPKTKKPDTKAKKPKEPDPKAKEQKKPDPKTKKPKEPDPKAKEQKKPDPKSKKPKEADSKTKKPDPKSKKPKEADPKTKKPNTLEEELEEQLSDEEIENFQIEKVDMEKLTNKVCEVLAAKDTGSMLQSDLWKKLKLTSRDGSRLALKLERMGTITREKLLENGRWTYRIILKKSPISTWSIEDAPCLVCPVEQRCSLEGETSPRNCQLIEDWVIAEMKRPKKPK